MSITGDSHASPLPQCSRVLRAPRATRVTNVSPSTKSLSSFKSSHLCTELLLAWLRILGWATWSSGHHEGGSPNYLMNNWMLCWVHYLWTYHNTERYRKKLLPGHKALRTYWFWDYSETPKTLPSPPNCTLEQLTGAYNRSPGLPFLVCFSE